MAWKAALVETSKENIAEWTNGMNVSLIFVSFSTSAYLFMNGIELSRR